MYIVDLFKRLFRKANIPVIIYLVLNLGLITSIVYGLLCYPMQLAWWTSIPISFALYMLSLLIALSPIGEWILRLQTGCKRLNKQSEIDFLEPLFREVYSEARKKDPSISPNVELFICDEECPNAFATGRKTVCVTRGLLHGMSTAQIKGTLAHEFGHLSHKDTDLILLVTVGNLIVNAIIMAIRIVLDICHFFVWLVSLFMGDDGVIISGLSALNRFLVNLFISGFMWVWTRFGQMLVLKSGRSNEYEADAFASEIGYGNELIDMLYAIDDGYSAKAHGLFAMLMSTHPDTSLRIAHLKELNTGSFSPESLGGASENRRIDEINHSNIQPLGDSMSKPYAAFSDASTVPTPDRPTYYEPEPVRYNPSYNPGQTYNTQNTQNYYSGAAPSAEPSSVPLVLGIISIVLNFMCLAPVSIVLGIIGLCQINASKKENKPYSKAGFVCSIIGLSIGGLFTLFLIINFIASNS